MVAISADICDCAKYIFHNMNYCNESKIENESIIGNSAKCLKQGWPS